MNRPQLSIPQLVAICGTIVAVAILVNDLLLNKKFDGELYALTFTLIVVIWYTYFTYKIAHKKDEPSVAVNLQYEPTIRSYRIIVQNLTNQYAKTRLWQKVDVYGKSQNDIKDYCGDTPWDLTPQLIIGSNFKPVENHLEKLVGKSFDDMVKEANNSITNKQFRLSLKVAWEDKDGEPCGEYEHHWYLDFRTNAFVYQVGGFSN